MSAAGGMPAAGAGYGPTRAAPARTPESRATTGFVLGIAGSVLIIVAGAIVSIVFLPFSSVFGLLGVAFGALVFVFSFFLYLRPAEHVTWGVLVLIFSCASIIGTGGFVVGMVLGIIGGVLGVAWEPYGAARQAYPGPYGVPVTPWRLCTGCGRWIPWTYNVCPLCGTQAPVAPWLAAPSPSPPAPAPPAGSPPPAPGQPIRAPCPTCNGQAEWIAYYGRWYCPMESRYF